MVLIILLAILGVGLLIIKDRIADGDGQTAAKVVGILALIIAGVLLLFLVLDDVDSGGGDRDLDAMVGAPLAWLYSKVRR